MTPEEIRAEAHGCQQFSDDGKMTKTEVSLIGVLGEIAAQLAELNEHVRSCPIEIKWRRPDGRRPQGAAPEEYDLRQPYWYRDDQGSYRKVGVDRL